MPIRRSPNGARHVRSQPGRNRPERVVAINRNAWSQSVGTGGRNHPVRARMTVTANSLLLMGLCKKKAIGFLDLILEQTHQTLIRRQACLEFQCYMMAAPIEFQLL